MKKSEAVSLLKEIILEHRNCYCDCCGDDPTMYWTILTEIQKKIGMEPPPYQEEYGTGYADECGYQITDVRWVQGWENENEK